MPLPILPALKAQGEAPAEGEAPSGEKSALAELLDSLDDSQVQELVAMAESYMPEDPDAEAEPDPEDPNEEQEVESGVEDPEAEEAVPDEETPEEDDAEAAPADLDAIEQQVSIDTEEAAHVVSQMQEMADSGSDSSPDVAKLLKQAVGLQEKIEKCGKVLAKAIKNEDTQAAAQAGIDARDYLDSINHLLAAAQSLGARTEAPGMTPSDHPAIKLWAARTQGKKPAIAPV